MSAPTVMHMHLVKAIGRYLQNAKRLSLFFLYQKKQKAAATDAQVAARVKLFLKRTPEELYDYRADPDARHNLAHDPQHRKTLDRLRARLLAHMRSTDDPQLDAFGKAIGQ